MVVTRLDRLQGLSSFAENADSALVTGGELEIVPGDEQQMQDVTNHDFPTPGGDSYPSEAHPSSSNHPPLPASAFKGTHDLAAPELSGDSTLIEK